MTALEVLVIGQPEALVLKVVGDAPGPDRVLVGVFRKLLSEVDLVADLGDPPGTQQDATGVLVERVAVIAVEEDERVARRLSKN
jgi:hypothetical protein